MNLDDSFMLIELQPPTILNNWKQIQYVALNGFPLSLLLHARTFHSSQDTDGRPSPTYHACSKGYNRDQANDKTDDNFNSAVVDLLQASGLR